MSQAKATPFASALLCGILLSACGPAATGPDSLGTEPYPIGDYSLVGDRIIVRFPASINWECEGDVLVKDTVTREPDTSQIGITGDRLRIFREPDSVYSPTGNLVFEGVVQEFTELERVSGRNGLEGRWRALERGYTVLSGALGAESKADLDGFAKYGSQQYEYVNFELEFSGGKVQSRVDGRFAEHFVDSWNGKISYDTGVEADSAYYDIDVEVVDRATVRMFGRKTGETVTLTFVGPQAVRRYASDNPAHPPYTVTDPITSCPETEGPWYSSFRRDNYRTPPILEKRAFSREFPLFEGVGGERL